MNNKQIMDKNSNSTIETNNSQKTMADDTNNNSFMFQLERSISDKNYHHGTGGNKMSKFIKKSNIFSKFGKLGLKDYSAYNNIASNKSTKNYNTTNLERLKTTNDVTNSYPNSPNKFIDKEIDAEHLRWLALNIDFNKSTEVSETTNRRLSLQNSHDNNIDKKTDKNQRKLSLIQEKDKTLTKIDLLTLNKNTNEKDFAYELFDENSNNKLVKLKVEEYAEFIGTNKPFNRSVLHCYMKLFEFKNETLDKAFRKLCKKLYLRAESQSIDRILYQFSKRYIDCNEKEQFSVDLHIAKGNHKMTRNQFIKNTALALSDLFRKNTGYNNKTIGKRINIFDYLKDLYNSVKNNPIIIYNDTIENNNSSSLSSKSSNSNMLFNEANAILRSNSAIRKMGEKDQLSLNLVESNDEQVVDKGQLMKTIMFRKNLFELEGKRSTSRSWKEILVEVNFNSYNLKISRSSKYTYLNANKSVSSGSSELIETISLLHALAVAMPNGYSASRPYVFALQLTTGAVILFQTRTLLELQNFVDAINCVCGKYSSLPLDGGVNNIDYGWDTAEPSAKKSTLAFSSDDLQNDIISLYEHEELQAQKSNKLRSPLSSEKLFNANAKPVKETIKIKEWNTPAYSTVPKRTVSIKEHLQSIQKHIQKLNSEMEVHMESKAIIDKRFRIKSTLHNKAFQNFEKKAQYLSREIVRYQNYYDSIQKFGY